MRQLLKYLFLVSLLLGCRQAYEPPAIKAPNNYLVVEGVINANAGERTTIKLSRTKNLTDTFVTNPVTAAIVQVQAKSGAIINFTEQPGGTYISQPLNLNTNETYRIKVVTNGNEYVSEYVPVKITPPIDSLNWKQDRDVTIYASTHDATNKARYYRWSYVETWQYRSAYETLWGVNGNTIYLRDPLDQVYNCWWNVEGSQIALANSARLSEDVIQQAPVTTIPQYSAKIAIRYSILVKQYALTEEAYKYWEILQKNTQSLGTLFDAQPGQLVSNIINTANPSEPVIGFASASTITEKRIFIDHSEVSDWPSLDPQPDCTLLYISQDPLNLLYYTYPDTAYAPYYFITGGRLTLARKACLQCTWYGGTNKKPAFW